MQNLLLGNSESDFFCFAAGLANTKEIRTDLMSKFNRALVSSPLFCTYCRLVCVSVLTGVGFCLTSLKFIL